MRDQPPSPGQVATTDRARAILVGLAVMLILLLTLLALPKLQRAGNQGQPLPNNADKLAASLQLQHTLPGYGSSVMEWSPDGRTLVGRSLEPRMLDLWDSQTGLLKSSYAALKDATNLKWSPDGRILAANSYYTETKTVPLLDVMTGQIVYTLTAPLPPGIPSVGPRYHRPFTNFGFAVDVLGWLHEGGRLVTHTVTAVGDGFTSEGLGAEYVQYDSIQTWDAATGKLLQDVIIQDPSSQTQLTQMALSPDGTLLAVMSYDLSKPQTPAKGKQSSPDLLVSIWDIGAGKLLHTLPPMTFDDPHLYSEQPLLVWSPDGQALAIELGRTLLLADAQKGQIMRTLPDVLPPTYTPTPFPTLRPPPSPQSTMPVAIDTAGLAPMPVPSAPPLGYTPPPTSTLTPTPTADAGDYGPVLGAAWSPDGQTVATFDYQSIRLWDWQSGKLRSISRQALSEPDPAFSHMINPIGAATVAWSPDGQMLVTLWNGNVVLRDPATGKMLRELNRSTGYLGGGPPVDAVRWSPDSHMLAVGYSEKLELWGFTAGP